MKYYHGTDKLFNKFDLNKAQEYKDFGRGIYLSINEKHAQKIALKKHGEHACIRIYDFSIKDIYNEFNIKIFN